MAKKIFDDEQVVQLADDLYQFLSDWSTNINLDNDLVNNRVRKLAEACIASQADLPEDEDDADPADYDNDMDQYADIGDLDD